MQGRPTREFSYEFGPIPIRERFDLIERYLHGVNHETQVHRCVLRAKLVGDSEV